MRLDIGAAWDTVRNGIGETWGDVKEGAASTWDAVKEGAGSAWNTVKDGVTETAELAREKTLEFHENYVSNLIPDCGKYGNEAKFVAEMVPGVAEYNALVDGDWTAFAIAAGIDIASIAVGAFTAGAGYAAIKGGSVAAKTGVRIAAKEIAEAGAEALVKEVVEAGVEKAVKETVEAGVEIAVRETVEAGVEVALKESAEAGIETVVRETVEAGVETAARETVEAGTEKAAKEIAEEGAEKLAKETTEQGAKSTDDVIHRFIECRNQGLEGARHPITGVEFARKTVDNGTGEIIEGVFPKFDSAFDTKLPKELFQESNFKQFKKANSDLLEQLDNTPDLRKKFTTEQIEQIKDGITTGAAPDGYVWHHNEEAGVLQLIDEAIHSKTGHTGGREIWGGGY